MSILERVYASAGPEVIIDTLQLSCPAWDAPLYLVQGYEDLTLGIETGGTQLFTCAPMTMSLPKRSNEAQQTLRFAIDNVTGQAQRLLDQAIEAETLISITFRRYLSTDLTGPAEPPFYATVLSGGAKGATVQIDAGFYDILNYAWPRDAYTVNFAPGLKYM